MERNLWWNVECELVNMVFRARLIRGVSRLLNFNLLGVLGLRWFKRILEVCVIVVVVVVVGFKSNIFDENIEIGDNIYIYLRMIMKRN